MIIRNPSDFAAFIKGSGLVNLSAETAKVVCCLDEYARMCACDPPEAKTAKFNQCREAYLGFACKAIAYKAQLLSKTGDTLISFYNNGQLLITLSR